LILPLLFPFPVTKLPPVQDTAPPAFKKKARVVKLPPETLKVPEVIVVSPAVWFEVPPVCTKEPPELIVRAPALRVPPERL
jgi:hypothetical protein